MPNDYKYWAFISYSHQDKAWGDWLHKSLETYRVPKRLIGRASRDGTVPKRLYPIFRDREELPTSADLGGNINQALVHSRYLIVICSPRSAASHWVNEEIKAFKALGREDRILCLIVDGEPNASDKPELGMLECFPEAVRYRVDASSQVTTERTEPIAADAREGKDGKESSRIKLVAGLLGVGFDELWQREKRRQFWHKVQAVTVILALAVGTYGIWWKIMQAESLKLASKSLELMKDDRNDEALKVLLNAVPRNPESPFSRPLVLEAQAALDLAMARNRLSFVLGGMKYETETIEMSPDGRMMATSSRDGTVRFWDTVTWTQIGIRFAFDRAAENDQVQGPKLDPERRGRPLAFHPSKPIIATGTVDGQVMLFNTDGSQNAVAVLRHATGYTEATSEVARRRFLIRTVAFDSRGERLVSASEDSTVRIWNWQSGKLLHLLHHPAPVKAAYFSPDGRLVATVCDDGATRLWNAATGKLVVQLSGGGGEFSKLRFDNAGNHLAVATSLRVLLWNVSNPALPRKIAELPHGDAVRWIEFSPDCLLLATASDDGSARLWDANTGKERLRVTHSKSVRRALFAPDGRHFATISEDRLIQFWDLDGRPVPGYALRGHTHFILAGAFTRDGNRLVTTSSDMTLRVWDMMPRSRGVVLQGHTSPVRQALFMPDGKSVITAGFDRRVLLFDASTGRRLDNDRFTEVHQDRVDGLALSTKGDQFVTVSRDNTAKLWSFVPASQPKILMRGEDASAPRSHDDEVTNAAFSPDGLRIVTTSRDSTARLWDAQTARPVSGIPPLQHTDGKPVWGAVFSPNGRLILTAGHDEQAGIWAADTGKNLHWLRPKESRRASINCAVFSPDTSVAATASDDHTVRLWDVATGQQIGSPLEHDDHVLSVAFHPAGKYLVSGSQNGTMRFWHVSDGKLLDIWYVHDGQSVQTIAFDAKGERIVTASADGTAHIWSTSNDRSRLLQEAVTTGRGVCRRTPGTPEWSDVWRWCPSDLAP
ncbi:MAG: TIR domain-containing protein [Sideroxyarcus sp.]|nr:TIR domain-containing protein [Sideroxyarcus sp.]